MGRRIKRLCRRCRRIERIIRRRSGWNLVGWPVVVGRKIISAVVGFVAVAPLVLLMMYMLVALG